MIFLSQNVRKSPVTQAMDVSEFAFAVENFLGPFTGKAERFGERAKELDDLGNVIVVLPVFGTGLWIEEVVTSYELEDLKIVRNGIYFIGRLDVP
jgi:hypothetical protein